MGTKTSRTIQAACPHAAYVTWIYPYDHGLYSSLMLQDCSCLPSVGTVFRENLETLVSYNVCMDGIQQDCLYIQQGHLMSPTTFMTYSMAVNPRKSVVVTWTPIKMYCTQQGSQPSSPQGSHFYTSS